jgi:hypothetical protein
VSDGPPLSGGRAGALGETLTEGMAGTVSGLAAAWRRAAAHPAVARWRWISFPVTVFLFTRVAFLGFSWFSMTLWPVLFSRWEAIYGPRVLARYPALDGLCRWDCWHFEKIAKIGYWNETETNFFPLFPLLGRVLHELTGVPHALALIIVANVAALGGYLVVYRIFTMLADEDGARWGLALLAAYPFAFFQATAYPETLMLFFGALSVLLALQGRHIWAGVALGFGVLARHLTLLNGAALLTAQVRERGRDPRRFLLSPAILGLIIPWLFLGLYCLYLYQQFGNPLTFLAARDEWGARAWWGIGEILTTAERSNHVRVMQSYVPFALLVTAGAVGLLTRKKWLELAAFAVVFMALLWTVGMWGLGRYSAACWPAFLPLGVWLARRPTLGGPVVATLAVFQGLFFYLFVHQFPIL